MNYKKIYNLLKILLIFSVVVSFASCSFDKTNEKQVQTTVQNTENNTINAVIKINEAPAGKFIQPSDSDYAELRKECSYTLSYCRDNKINEYAIKRKNLSYENLRQGIVIEGLSSDIWTFAITGALNEEDENYDYIDVIYLSGIKTEQLLYSTNSITITLKEVKERTVINDEEEEEVVPLYGKLSIDYYALSANTVSGQLPKLYLYYYDENDNTINSYIDFLKSFNSGTITPTKEINLYSNSNDHSISDNMKSWGLTNPDTVKKYYLYENSSPEGLITLLPGLYWAKLTVPDSSNQEVVIMNEQVRICAGVTTRHELFNEYDSQTIIFMDNSAIVTWSEENQRKLEEKHERVYFKGNPKTLTTIPTKEGYTFGGWYYDADFSNPLEQDENNNYIYDPGTNVTLLRIYAKWNND